MSIVHCLTLSVTLLFASLAVTFVAFLITLFKSDLLYAFVVSLTTAFAKAQGSLMRGKA